MIAELERNALLTRKLEVAKSKKVSSQDTLALDNLQVKVISKPKDSPVVEKKEVPAPKKEEPKEIPVPVATIPMPQSDFKPKKI